MKANLLKSPLQFSVVLLAIMFLSCAQGILSSKDSGGGPGEEKPGSSETVAGKSGTGQALDVKLSPPVIRPISPILGKKVSFQMQYALSSPDKAKEFDVLELVILTGSKLRLELSRKTLRKTQGAHVLTLEFIIPPNLPPGPYKAIGTIKTAGLEKQEAVDFIVKRRK